MSAPGRTSAPGRWTRWLALPIYVGCAAAFATDVLENIHLFFGLFYLPLVCTAVFYRSPRAAWWLAGTSSAMVVIGFFFPVINPDTITAVVNRVLSIAAIWMTAALVRHGRAILERLAEQTERAEAGERLKSEIFNMLSDEMRRPVRSMISLSAVMSASAGPGQREALSNIHASSQQLSATLDNLTDLTRIDDQEIRIAPVDVVAIATEAVAAAVAAARQRQIELRVDGACARSAHGDAWAVRRILDNLMSNAVKFSRPGGIVRVATVEAPGTVSVVVRDEGAGIPDSVLNGLARPDPQQAAIGAGLTLCRRLAAAMGAELSFDRPADGGTTATLRLPA